MYQYPLSNNNQQTKFQNLLHEMFTYHDAVLSQEGAMHYQWYLRLRVDLLTLKNRSAGESKRKVFQLRKASILKEANKKDSGQKHPLYERTEEGGQVQSVHVPAVYVYVRLWAHFWMKHGCN